jgi:glycosyltransferase involved in cell wall biosynthesis
VLPCRVAGNGDRDGIPNVLIEAQSQGLACISTDVSAVPELIRDYETGLLVPPDEPGELAKAIESLMTNPPLRQELGAKAARHVRQTFDASVGISTLSNLLTLSLGEQPPHSEIQLVG